MQKRIVRAGTYGGRIVPSPAPVYLFCSPELNYISGQVIVCGGGPII